MVCEITKDTRSPLLPDRQGQGDFFVCDIFDAAPKGDMASMAHPIFSLSTKPDHRIRRYENESGKSYLEVKPSADGLATIHDRDVLIYCISQIMAALNEGQQVSRTVRLKAYDLLKATNRVTDGRGYDGLRAALIRLQGTQVETNIVTGGEEQLDIFSIIDRARIVRETREGRMQEIEIQLSDWVFNAIQAHEVLTLHRNYFRLRKPLERRLYELGRKHCGKKTEWRISLPVLQRKCGSASTPREFRRLVANIIKQDETHNHIPDYAIRLEDQMVIFRNRQADQVIELDRPSELCGVSLSSEAYAAAREVAPGWDIYALEAEWRAWMQDGGLDAPKDADKAFTGFCRKWFEKRGRP
ncbi:replication initiator protein A [Sulfitobacter mediterraneus]|uniref:replication initiator protein A n=1 Tax=Sulfitobacter mediterraneus TaxID=83219 RepID=UPI001933C64E|nr:replication initiator protein A [Sulfitobacter mediterraneus]MBM1643000.1 replication initiator protein A [Sulfitobacter mediterraneus]MBM1647040.1 replication initiator protein A [Sulfitobacter mediterraneus]MBM1651099.1 replication initiator protein A [Sulfitobacter mediterraneus]MBM1655107.1 replication initiator protein A [Sulfitobacter mediterraneus]MBM1659196.1 replication initiator protein A [Sulfitobacter mediterraneus]